jgi:hypothetical protein
MKSKGGKTGRLLGLGLGGAAVGSAITLGARRLRAEAEVARRRRALEGPSDVPRAYFDPAVVTELPEPVQRYFLHTLAPGAPIGAGVRLTMRGELREGPRAAFRPFKAEQVIVPQRGYLWKAWIGGGVPAASVEWLDGDRAGARTFPLGVWPSAEVEGFDRERAAAGRLAIEAILAPGALLPGRGVRWEVEGPSAVRATLRVAGEPQAVTLALDAAGRVRTATLLRWSDRTEDGRYTWIPFGIDVDEERSFGGVTLPCVLRAAFWYGTEKRCELYRAEITAAEVLPGPGG